MKFIFISGYIMKNKLTLFILLSIFLAACGGQSGENGWVFATNVEVSVNTEQIPIVTP